MSIGAVIGSIVGASVLLGINIWLSVSSYFLKRQFTLTDKKIENLQQSLNEFREDIKKDIERLEQTMLSRSEFEIWREGIRNGSKWHST